VPPHERRADRARRLAQRGLTALGVDLREVRLRASLSLRQLSVIVGVSPAELSRIERGMSPHVAYETLVSIGAGLGLDVPIRGFPNGQTVRDAAQLELMRRLRALLPAGLRLRSEVPLGIQGDLRAWDGVIEGAGWWRPVELESRIRDVQALQGRVRLKCRDGNAPTVLLVVADTRHNRHVLRAAADELAEMFPVTSRDAIAALRSGRAPAGSAVVLL
jgi:transcriptional regulator with XRE-family HTH domain